MLIAITHRLTMASNPPSPSGIRRRVVLKRQCTTPTSAVNGSSAAIPDDKVSEFLCPICLEIISEAYITRCGHSFCHKCITQSLEVNRRCPKCSFTLGGSEQLVPNFLLNELILKLTTKTILKSDSTLSSKPELASIQSLLLEKYDNLDIADITPLLNVLTKRKLELEVHTDEANKELMTEFLDYLLKEKEEQLRKVNHEVNLIKRDRELVQSGIGLARQSNFNSQADNVVATFMPPKPSGSSVDTIEEHTMAVKRKKVYLHYEDLATCYFSCRENELNQENLDNDLGLGGLEKFNASLLKFSRYSTLRPLATLNYTSDIFNNSSIVSSIEFDKDKEFFAIAGVTKRIKVFEYGSVIRDTVDIHYPCVEMMCNSKISCVSWSPYHKGMLASSDYEGTVTVWDSTTAQRKKVYQEHEKRCWSVDFNRIDTKLIASGSDDARVKLWSVNMDHSVASLEAKANVCCVKFNPESRYHIAFGSADHCVHYYDLRNNREPVTLLKGHRKAVSYVKFVDKDEIVSASTDSQLRLWDIKKVQAIRSFVGHANEKNFVGLATDGNYVACGSENNALYVYYKGLSKQLFNYKFDSMRGVFDKDRKEEETNEFVSAVCWKEGSNVVVAANSQGIIKILELA